MALHLHRLGHGVSLLARRMEQATDIASVRENRLYLPGITLPDSLQVGCEVMPALMEADVMVFASPVKGLHDLAVEVKRCRDSSWALRQGILLAKGLDHERGRLPMEVVREVLPDLSLAVLSGPTYAREVAQGRPAAVVLAAREQDSFFGEVQAAFNGGGLRVYRSYDEVGVSWAGILKNVYAIASGICDGLGLGDNARASLATRALQEMVRIGERFGGTRETLFGLAGVGDFMATIHGSWSRNRGLGEEVGRGAVASAHVDSHSTVAEGFESTRQLHRICREQSIEAPILEQMYAVLFEDRPPEAALRELMSRDLREE